MNKNRLEFLNDAFPGFTLQFADDFSSAAICNPNCDENVMVYDEEYEFIVCFSFQHRHFESPEKVVNWIVEILSNNLFAIEFFNNGQRRFGGEINANQLQELTYEKLEQFTGYYGVTKLFDVADSFKIRGWHNCNNFDFTFFREANGSITLIKTNV